MVLLRRSISSAAFMLQATSRCLLSVVSSKLIRAIFNKSEWRDWTVPQYSKQTAIEEDEIAQYVKSCEGCQRRARI